MTVSAGLGIAGFNFSSGEGANGDGFWEWVDLCEASGVNSLWQSDRLIGNDGSLECLSTMAALAGRTRRIKFGMNVASLGLRDPVVTAKACATIDVLSNGRLLPAFGVGSARSRDYSATGTPTKGRGKRAAEGLEIMSRLWTEDSVDFRGEHYTLEGASITPKPLQKPLPLWVGGSAPQAVERTARWGTGWQAGIETPDEVGPVIEQIKAALPGHGRSIDEDHYGAGFAFRFGSRDEPICQRHDARLEKLLGKDPQGLSAVGGAAEILGLVERFRAIGVHKFILRPIAQGASEVMEQTQRLIDEVLPEIARLNQ